MANLSEDIQCAGSDTQPPMLDRTDFASWQQRIHLYCQGKENEGNILKSIVEGPFQMGIFRETLAEGEEGAFHLGPEGPRVYSNLLPEEKDRHNDDIQATNILLQGLPKHIYTLINHYADAKDIWDNVKMLLEGQQNRGQGKNARGVGTAGYGGAQNSVRNANSGQAKQIKCYNCNALSVDNVVQADDCDAFDSDVGEAPTIQTMFIANLSPVDLVYYEAGLSYDSYILSEVHDHDHYQDVVCEHHEVHEMHDDVKPNYVVDSHDDYTIDSNMILYDQYVKHNIVPVVQSNVSSVPNDAYIMILNDMHEQPAQHVSVTTQNNAVDKSLTAELATYKEQVELITPTGLTEGERGFEQTKECYLTEVILFFKTLKDHFEGIQKALTKEMKEMKEIFKELEAKVDQNVVHEKHDEIEQKNLLITNDNLIANFLYKDVFYTATDFVLIVSRFSDMHEALSAAQKRIAKLEYENSTLQNKIQNDDYDVMVQSRGNTIRMLREKISRLTMKHSHAVPIHDLKALDSQNKELHAKVNALYDLSERWQAKNEKVKRHYKELYDSIKITRAKTIEKTNSLLTEVANLKAHIQENHKSNCVIIPAIKSIVLTPGMYVIDVEPIPPRKRNNREVHLDYLKHLKESVATIHEILEEARVEKPLDSSLAYA
nr:integrase, catalytic region, zinc finger, CCHC-type, peptidase aspartic, catalytic [Tanacetum cinerariifolium]